MNIVLLADDEKRELMTEFCISKRNVLRQHRLFTTKALAELIERKTNLRIYRVVDTFAGGYQQISAYLSCHEVDLLIFFRNPVTTGDVNPDEYAMLCMCDRHGVPVATNLTTAEMLISTIRRNAVKKRSGGQEAAAGAEKKE